MLHMLLMKEEHTKLFLKLKAQQQASHKQVEFLVQKNRIRNC